MKLLLYNFIYISDLESMEKTVSAGLSCGKKLIAMKIAKISKISKVPER